jgi:hypothetical protein
VGKLTGAPIITTDLTDTIEELLRRTSALFHPGLLWTRPEELGRLEDGNVGALAQKRQGLLEEVGAWAEIGVEDREEFARRDGESVAEIASFLQVAPILAADVVEPVSLRKLLDGVQAPVVEDVDPVVGVRKSSDMLVCVGENFERLSAAGK